MNTNNQYQLLRERRFFPFFVTQLLGALNDNLYKNALITLLAFQITTTGSLDAATLINLSGAVFILPFFLFSATAGQLADKYEKSRFIQYVKLLEIGIMLIATVGFVTHHLVLLFVALFLMGLHSTFFGPVKYAILPQNLSSQELIGGNALIDAGTFIAILAGTILGIVLISFGGFGVTLACIGIVSVAVSGWLVSRAIPKAPAPAPDLRINWNPFTETWRNLALLRERRTVFLSVLGISWFWFFGLLLLSQFPLYARDYLGGGENIYLVLLTVFSIGIGAGSLLCERLSDRKIEIGLVPFGSIGLTAFGVDLYFAAKGVPSNVHSVIEFMSDAPHWRLAADLLLVGMFGGFYVVPLYALVQNRSDVSYRSRVIAGNNILNALFMVCAALLGVAMLKFGFTIPQIFLVGAILNAVVAIYIYSLVPEFLIRFLVWLLVHSVYRLNVRGMEKIPERGPVLLVCNHVSFVDSFILGAACPRPIRFVMDYGIYRIPVMNLVFKSSKTIPIAPARENAEMLEKGYNEIAAAFENGDVVCIFPEGRLTADGELSPFRPGVNRVIKRTPVLVIPMALRGLWDSFFSRKHGRAMSNWSIFVPFKKVAVVVGDPLQPEQVTPAVLQQQVQELRGNWR